MSAQPLVGSTRTVGTSAQRVEDTRILTGTGRYVDDMKLPGMLHAAFVRSPFPHARILGVDVDEARRLDGVLAVYTGADFAARTSPIEPLASPPGYLAEPFYALAIDKARFVGDPVAIVIAVNRYVAEDACELIEVDYDQLPAIASFDEALDPDGAVIFESLGTNVVLEMATSLGDVEGAFNEADVVLRERFSQHRVAQVPMETRGGIGDFDAITGDFTYHTGTQSPHSVRSYLAQTLGLPLERVRVLNGDIGGAFGLKISVHREDVAVCAASYWLGRPVKWIEDRNEHLLASGQAREERMDLEAAVNRDGTILALRGNLVLDEGAYPAVPFPGGIIVGIISSLMPGPYDLRGFAMTSTVVKSNKCTYSAYRAPWAIETWARERMIDLIAVELGLDPGVVRHRNFARNDGSTSMLTGRSLLGNTCAQSLERALELADYDRLRLEQTRSRAEDRCVGIGFATFLEAAPGPATGAGFQEKSRARLDEDGYLSIFTTQAPHGQSHETTLAQIASDELGIPIEKVRIRHGDTSNTHYATVGTGGSRAATMASGSVLHSTRLVKQQVLAIAADMLEANPADLVVAAGVVHPRGVPSAALTLASIAERVYSAPQSISDEVAPSLEAEANYDGGLGGWSNGTHLCQVEIDLQTGHVDIVRYLVVEDCGRMINPAVVEGQIRGGVAQGIGEVLYEWSAYDDQAQPVAGSFLDYLLPTCTEIPPIEIDHLENEPNEEVNYRGVGEGGLLIAPAALTNAIEDALRPFGAKITHQYLTPARILELAGVIRSDAETSTSV